MGYEFIKNIKYFANCFLDFLYNHGEECVACGEYLHSHKGISICSECSTEIKMCNKSFEILNEGMGILCYSSFYYSGLGKELIGRLKYKSDFKAGEVLAKYMSNTIKSYNLSFDLITYVPSSKVSMKKRGYNQSEYLAKRIGNEIQVKVLSLLKKTKETKDQIGLSGEERWKNLEGCFEAVNEKVLKGKKILLVDDVITTGATAFHCSKLMLNKGADKVYIVSSAKSNI